VAYLRFASVYRSFESADDFETEIAILRAERDAAADEAHVREARGAGTDAAGSGRRAASDAERRQGGGRDDAERRSGRGQDHAERRPDGVRRKDARRPDAVHDDTELGPHAAASNNTT
jgi:hypothetical protein